LGDIIEFRPFQFYTQLRLIEMTGERANTLGQLLEYLKTVSGSVIYCHTFQTMLQHHFITSGFRNDFALWVEDAIGDRELGERLAAIDQIEYTTIRSYREKMIEIVEDHISKDKSMTKRKARKNQDFFLCSCLSFVIPTNREAHSLEEFSNHLQRCSNSSIFFHFVEARLRVGTLQNDFSVWLIQSLGMKELADKINALDPYACSLGQLKEKIVELVETEL